MLGIRNDRIGVVSRVVNRERILVNVGLVKTEIGDFGTVGTPPYGIFGSKDFFFVNPIRNGMKDCAVSAFCDAYAFLARPE